MREARLRWFGHMQMRDAGYARKRVLKMEPQGRSRRGRPKRRLMDVVMEDMRVVGKRCRGQSKMEMDDPLW